MLWLHRWLGIIVGVHFVLLGLSGSYLVYADEIDAILKKNLKVAVGQTQTPDLQRIAESAQKGLATDKEPLRITLASRQSGYNHEVMFNIPQGEQKRRFITAYVDASNFEYRGADVFKETLTGFLFVFHHDLFSGPLGRTAVGITGVLSMLILLGGLYLWWPGKNKSWKRALRYNSQKSFLGMNLELHKVAGFYSLILMAIVTFSGIYLAKPDWFFARKGERNGRPNEVMKAGWNYPALQVSLETLLVNDEVSQLRKDMNSGRIIGFARNEDAGVRRWEWDAQNGSLLTTQYLQDRSFENKFGDLQRSWHVGDFWGAVGRFLVFLSGLLPLFFYVTGFYVWSKKKSLRQVKNHAI